MRLNIIILRYLLTPETYHLVDADAITYGMLRQR